MTAEELLESWTKDGTIDNLHVEEELRRIPNLHSKYLGYLTYENRKLRRIEKKKKALIQNRTEYYFGHLNPSATSDNRLETLRTQSKYPDTWEPFSLGLTRIDIERFTETAPDVLDIIEAYGEQKQIVDNLVYIMKEIANRNFHLRGIIDHRKFIEAVGGSFTP